MDNESIKAYLKATNMQRKCLKCGKPAKFTFIKGWTKHEEGVGEVGGWDSVEGEDIEIHLCKEHADLFGEDPNFRSQMIEMHELGVC